MSKTKYRTQKTGFRKAGVVFFFSLVFFPLLLPGQSSAQDFRRLYRNAKELFDDKQFNLAMEAFKPLIVYDRNNPFAEYASFYYAVSAHEQGYSAVAKDMLLQTRKLYPEWEQIAEVNYWLGKLYFDQREYFQGMLMLREITQPEWQPDLISLKRHYFSMIDDPETLRMLLEEYPSESEAARVLARHLATEAHQPRVLAQFDSLVSVFHFDRSEFNLNHGPVSVMKDKYVVSLLLPFLANTLEPTPTPKVNQQILELYNGIRLAHDTLTAQGIQIDLRLYDTERSEDKLKEILNSEELKDSDLLVGPIFTEVSAVKEFSVANRICMVSPGSNNADFISENPYGLLFQPSFETMGRRAAELVATRVKNKNCIVYFGDAVRDSIQAFNFMLRAKELGVNIVLAEEHRRETAGAIITTLTTPTEFDEFKNATQYTLKRDSIGTIYVASDNPLIYSKVNSSVTTRGDSIIVVGSEGWISPENTSVNLENYERMGVILAAPRFYSDHASSFSAFRKAYLIRYGVYPSASAISGYEFMLFMGKALSRYGTYFQPGLSGQGFTPGTIYQGFDYTGGQDNQYVPFIQFQNGQLVVVNSHR